VEADDKGNVEVKMTKPLSFKIPKWLQSGDYRKSRVHYQSEYHDFIADDSANCYLPRLRNTIGLRDDRKVTCEFAERSLAAFQLWIGKVLLISIIRDSTVVNKLGIDTKVSNLGMEVIAGFSGDVGGSFCQGGRMYV
jgi:hypothetical protein